MYAVLQHSYVAPEVITLKPYSIEVDMWSCGVILYILLSGHPPFHSTNQQKLYRLIRTGTYTFYPSDWCAVSDEAKDLIEKMLTVDPKKRITAKDALQVTYRLYRFTLLYCRSS